MLFISWCCALAREYRPPGEEGDAFRGETFRVVLQSRPGTKVRLDVEGAAGPTAAAALLINERTAASYDLRAQRAVTLAPQDSIATFQLVLGSRAYAERARRAAVPAQVALLPNYPNPFRGQTQLGYALPEAAEVRLTVYDVLGRVVRRLASGRMRAGRHQVRWDGRSDGGQAAASGVYFVRLEALGQQHVVKMTIVR